MGLPTSVIACECWARAHALGVKVIGCAGTVYRCPIRGDITTEDVAKIVRFYIAEGAQTIMLGDTTGVANPTLVRPSTPPATPETRAART